MTPPPPRFPPNLLQSPTNFRSITALLLSTTAQVSHPTQHSMASPEQAFLFIFLIGLTSIPFLSLSTSSLLLPLVTMLSQLASIAQLFGGALFLLIILVGGIAIWEALSSRFQSQSASKTAQTVHPESTQTSSSKPKPTILPIVVLVISLLIIASFGISLSSKTSLPISPSHIPFYRPEPHHESQSTDSSLFQLFFAVAALVGILLSTSSMKNDYKAWKSDRRRRRLLGNQAPGRQVRSSH